MSWVPITINLSVHVIMCKSSCIYWWSLYLISTFRLLLLCHCWWCQDLGMHHYQKCFILVNLLIMCSFIVEKISDEHADQPIRHRPLRCVLRRCAQWLSASASMFADDLACLSSQAYHKLAFESCVGTTTAALSGVGLLTSYLFLFVDFYIRTYKPTPKKADSKTAPAKN